MSVGEEQQEAHDLGMLVLILSDYNNQRYDPTSQDQEREIIKNYFKNLQYLTRNNNDLERYQHRIELFKKNIASTAQHALETEQPNAETIGIIGCTALLSAICIGGYALYHVIKNEVFNVPIALATMAFSAAGIWAADKSINTAKAYKQINRYNELLKLPAETWKKALTEHNSEIRAILGEYYENRVLDRPSTRHPRPRIRKL